MPVYIHHRVNLHQALHDCDPQGGAEIDLRADTNRLGGLYLSHDPWTPGCDFSAWLAVYSKLQFAGPLVLNTKEDGLEATIMERLKEFGIGHYFFLDTTAPTLLRWLNQGLGKHLSVRMSAFENSGAITPWFKLAGVPNPGWLWVDCFGGKPLPPHVISAARAHAKLCLVSPELQNQPLETINHFTHLIPTVDAICTKNPRFWQQTQLLPGS